MGEEEEVEVEAGDMKVNGYVSISKAGVNVVDVVVGAMR